jgi:hypothetical protein
VPNRIVFPKVPIGPYQRFNQPELDRLLSSETTFKNVVFIDDTKMISSKARDFLQFRSCTEKNLMDSNKRLKKVVEKINSKPVTNDYVFDEASFTSSASTKDVSDKPV